MLISSTTVIIVRKLNHLLGFVCVRESLSNSWCSHHIMMACLYRGEEAVNIIAPVLKAWRSDDRIKMADCASISIGWQSFRPRESSAAQWTSIHQTKWSFCLMTKYLVTLSNLLVYSYASICFLCLITPNYIFCLFYVFFFFFISP